jgi:hypothetical protein
MMMMVVVLMMTMILHLKFIMTTIVSNLNSDLVMISAVFNGVMIEWFALLMTSVLPS